MLAEDNILNQKVFTRLMRHHDVKIADEGKQAFEMFKANPDAFDCIFMDVHMPVMNGLDSTCAIRELEKNLPGQRHIPIVAVTAGVLESEQAECLAVGMDAVIIKPVSRKSLEAVLQLIAHKIHRQYYL